MTEIKVMLAQEYSPEIDPTGWWLSEKLNGIRATWDVRYVVSIVWR